MAKARSTVSFPKTAIFLSTKKSLSAGNSAMALLATATAAVSPVGFKALLAIM